MILTEQEATDILKLSSPEDCPTLNIFLPAIDDLIESDTGHDWSKDTNIDPTAKLLASALLVRWFSNPGQIGEEIKSNDPLISLVTKLHAKALEMLQT